MKNDMADSVLKTLRQNNFDVYWAESAEQAGELFFAEIMPALKPQTVSWGDSMTMRAANVLEKISADPDIVLIKPFDKNYSAAQKLYWRRAALGCDLFLSGVNALTKKGQLINLDMVGNRVGAITFGPKNVVLFVGVNKIVEDLDAAFARIKSVAAPQNAARHENFHTPCQKTGECMDCHSPDRICNTWVITEKSWPKGRIKIVLINEKLGL